MEEVFWKQKAKNSWLNEGDRNTKHFHALASERARRAMITSIKDESGKTISNRDQIKAVAVHFFEQLFRADSTRLHSDFLQAIPSILTAQDNEDLLALPSIKETQEAAFAILKEGALGPDGFSSSFFIEYGFSSSFSIECWNIVGEDIHKAACSLFTGGPLPRAFVASLICCKVLPKLISMEQGAFVQGRSITENITMTLEGMRNINRKIRGRNIILKLDLEKAYDKVDWNVLKQVLQLAHFGFSERWISIMEACWGNS
ncbi:uncharacterized protein LOC131228872 [Magnolia sinica]|uniref:uncharacterized protein LOC131228872 n=1 Tax=Magnolia sinica TaxID=86752 RepID=UPI00265AB2AC|nr:uncharacterized protein LOC131228872 [Magnolia sinica]